MQPRKLCDRHRTSGLRSFKWNRSRGGSVVWTWPNADARQRHISCLLLDLAGLENASPFKWRSACRAPPGSVLSFALQSDGKLKSVRMERAALRDSTVRSRMLGLGVARIWVAWFSAPTDSGLAAAFASRWQGAATGRDPRPAQRSGRLGGGRRWGGRHFCRKGTRCFSRGHAKAGRRQASLSTSVVRSTHNPFQQSDNRRRPHQHRL